MPPPSSSSSSSSCSSSSSSSSSGLSSASYILWHQILVPPLSQQADGIQAKQPKFEFPWEIASIDSSLFTFSLSAASLEKWRLLGSTIAPLIGSIIRIRANTIKYQKSWCCLCAAAVMRQYLSNDRQLCACYGLLSANYGHRRLREIKAVVHLIFSSMNDV